MFNSRSKIWVDSVCINQKDPAERSSQVAMMRDIYESSEEVVIWLGDRGFYDDLGEQLLGGVSDHPTTPYAVSYLNWYGDERDRPEWELFIIEQQRGSFDVGTRNVFGAFCIIWLLSIGVVASNIVHLRHLSQSATLINGMHAIMEQYWVRTCFALALT
jgi:hypothetical protein